MSGLPLSPSLKKYANEASRNGESLLVVDAGANIGASALYFTQLDPRIYVCAVEPDPGNFMVLRENAMGLPITAVEAAVASEDGKLWLSDPGIGEWDFASEVSREISRWTHHDRQYSSAVSAAVPLICKIDIEGGEADLFSNDDAWVDRSR